LTIASGITVKGAGGTIGYNAGWGGPANVALVNQGSIGPDRVGTVLLAGASFTNQGTLQASGGGTLNLLATAWEQQRTDQRDRFDAQSRQQLQHR
jgi:hypothetical protein